MPGHNGRGAYTAGEALTSGRTLDHAAKVYDCLNPLMTFYQEGRFIKKAIELLALNGGESILDIGCGTGTASIEIAKSLPHEKRPFVTGMDAAPRMIEVAEKKSRGIGNISFDVGIAERLLYEDASFDRVISTFFFHHVNFELKQRSLREIWRVLKRDGTAVIIDVDIPTNLFGWLCAWCGYLIFWQDEIKENISGRLEEALEGADFRSWHRAASYLGYISIFKLEK